MSTDEDIALLRDRIRDVPDFPKKGILFKDITPLLRDPRAFSAAVDALADRLRGASGTAVAAVEARGFIFGAALAVRLGVGFVPVRKKGKLPYRTRSVTYDLEYGTDTLEVHEDALTSEDRVLVVDDLLATGGTAAAVARLIEGLGGRVAGMGFVVELTFLNGRERLGDVPVSSLIRY